MLCNNTYSCSSGVGRGLDWSKFKGKIWTPIIILWGFNIPPLPLPARVNSTFCTKSHLKSSISDHFLVYQQKQAYFLLSVSLWYLLIIETIIHSKSVKAVEIHRATKPLIKYPPCSEIGAFMFWKIPLAQVKASQSKKCLWSWD